MTCTPWSGDGRCRRNEKIGRLERKASRSKCHAESTHRRPSSSLCQRIRIVMRPACFGERSRPSHPAHPSWSLQGCRLHPRRRAASGTTAFSSGTCSLCSAQPEPPRHRDPGHASRSGRAGHSARSQFPTRHRLIKPVPITRRLRRRVARRPARAAGLSRARTASLPPVAWFRSRLLRRLGVSGQGLTGAAPLTRAAPSCPVRPDPAGGV